MVISVLDFGFELTFGISKTFNPIINGTTVYVSCFEKITKMHCCTEIAFTDKSHLLMLALSQRLISHDAPYFSGILLRSCLSRLENQSLIKLNDTLISWTAAKHKHTVMKIT